MAGFVEGTGVLPDPRRGRSAGSPLMRVLASMFMALFVLLMTEDGPLAEEPARVAILPFQVHSVKPLDYLRQGLQEMFSIRMAKQGFQVVNPEVINTHPMIALPVLEVKDIQTIGKDLKADWIILGSLTYIGNKVSLDLKVVDISGEKAPFSIFMVEDDIDRLTDAIERASTSIHNQVTGVVQIDSIRVTGNRRIENEAILAQVESKKGEGLDKEKLDRDLRTIFQMGYFTEVNIDTEDGPKGKIVVFRVTEKPSIGRISFDGNKEVKDEDLTKATGIKIYSILNPNDVRQSVTKIKDLYKEKSYYNAEVQESIEDIPENEVALTYKIDEGAKVYIRNIQFEGNTEFTDSTLRKVMETREKGFFSWFTKSGVLDEKKLAYDVHKITTFYHDKGFITVKVGEPKVTFDGQKALTITIEVVEGHRYGVRDVGVEGDLIKPEEELLARVKIKKEDFFSRETIRADTLALQGIYANEGYAYAEVAPIIKEDHKNHLVDISYRISQKKRVRFERINITGNKVTRDKVIRRELKVLEGDYFSGEGLRRSTENFHRLGFFEDVEVKTRKGSQDDLMILDIDIKERSTGSFSMGIGYSTFDKALAIFQISQNNLLGRGQKLAATAKISGRTTEFDIGFTEPWLFDKPLSAGIDLYKWETEFDEFTKESLGTALRFGFPIGLGEYTKGSVKYVLDSSDIFDVAADAANAIKEMKGNSIKSSVTLGVKRDSKDRPWETSTGSVNSITYEYAGGVMGGDIAFDKYMGTSGWYFPLWWQTVLFIQGRVGYIVESAEGKLPVFEKFFLGGINTVRGFEVADISPRDAETGDKIGGEKMWIYNLEYRFPLVKKQGVVGILFFDAGNVFRKEEDFKFEGRRAVGTGIRYYSPIRVCPSMTTWGHRTVSRPRATWSPTTL